MLTFQYTGVAGEMVVEDVLTTGMIGRQAKLLFSPEWSGFTKTAVFTNGEVTVDVLNADEIVTIPSEVLAKPLKQLWVGVYGVSPDGKTVPTVYAKGPLVYPGADPSGDESTDESLPVWAQLQNQIKNLGQGDSGTSGEKLEDHNTDPASHEDIRNEISALSNEKLDISELQNAINTSLAEAKASGEFDGKDGLDATPVTPLFANSEKECSDTTKPYVLPDGYIYAHTYRKIDQEVMKEVSTTYSDGRLSVSDGSIKTSASGSGIVTDFIDISQFAETGFTLKLSGIQWAEDSAQNQDCAVVLYDENKVLSNRNYLMIDHTYAPGMAVIGDENNVTVTLSQEFCSGAHYIRIGGMGDKANAKIEIPYTESVERSGWVNTGHQFIVAYLDMIGIVDEGNVIRLSARNLPAGTYTLMYGDETYETIGTITVA